MAHLTATFEGRAPTPAKRRTRGQRHAGGGDRDSERLRIPRHSDGLTRINVGRIEGGTASNVIAEEVTIEAEVRGETTALMEYTRTELERVCYAAAEMHDCDVTPRVISESPRRQPPCPAGPRGQRRLGGRGRRARGADRGVRRQRGRDLPDGARPRKTAGSRRTSSSGPTIRPATTRRRSISTRTASRSG